VEDYELKNVARDDIIPNTDITAYNYSILLIILSRLFMINLI